jgi:hypothetical protein
LPVEKDLAAVSPSEAINIASISESIFGVELNPAINPTFSFLSR